MPLILYSRWSTNRQEAGDSSRRQIQAFKDYCTANGHTAGEVYTDAGISGYKIQANDRQAFNQLITGIKNGSITGSGVCFEQTSRLSRAGFQDVYTVITELLSLGWSVHIIKENIVLPAGQKVELVDIMRLVIYGEHSMQDSLKRSQMVGAVYANRRKLAQEGKKIQKSNTVFWLDKLPDYSYTMNDKAVFARMIVDMRLQGSGCNKIAKALNAAGARTSRGNTFSPTAVRNIICSTVLYGTYTMVDQTTVEQYFPAVCSKDEYIAIQVSKCEYRAKGTTGQNPIVGITRCSCGGTLTLKTMKHKSKDLVYRTWQCANQLRGTCEHRPYRDLDLGVYAIVRRLHVGEVDNCEEIERLDLEIMKLDARLDQLQKLLLVSDNISDVDAAISACKAQRSPLLDEKNKLVAMEVCTQKRDIKLLRDYEGDYENYNLLLRKHVSEIVCTKINKNRVDIRVSQVNGHWIAGTMVRDNEQAGWKTWVGTGSEEIMAL